MGCQGENTGTRYTRVIVRLGVVERPKYFQVVAHGQDWKEENQPLRWGWSGNRWVRDGQAHIDAMGHPWE
jgi:hypothetical protein